MSFPPTHTLQAKQGDTFKRVFTYKDDDGNAIDLTGCSVEFSIARTRGGAPAWTYDSAPEVVITNDEGGEITVTLTPAQTRLWERREEFVYELTVTFTDDTRTTILEGALEVRLEVVDETEA